MVASEPVYPALEDSQLLASVVRTHAKGRVLDMGCGSGVQSRAALERKGTTILGVDINPVAVEYCRTTISRGTFIESDLFSDVPKQEFDTIIFNPPYLPSDEFPADHATIGGQHGWETIGRFLDVAPDYLADNGKILLLFTSRTGQEKVHELITTALLDWKQLATTHIDFETYYVYSLTKNVVRQEAKAVKEIRYYTHGKRGMIYKGKIGRKIVALKIENPRSDAFGRLANEARMLKIVNKKKIGPKLLFAGEHVVCYEFVPGALMKDWLATASKKDTLKVLRDVLKQCFALDMLNVQKEEMNHPYKHIVIGKKTVLLDFERGHHTEHPHNVTQYCQYLRALAPELDAKKIFINETIIRRAAGNYSRFPDKRTLAAIMALLH